MSSTTSVSVSILTNYEIPELSNEKVHHTGKFFFSHKWYCLAQRTGNTRNPRRRWKYDILLPAMMTEENIQKDEYSYSFYGSAICKKDCGVQQCISMIKL